VYVTRQRLGKKSYRGKELMSNQITVGHVAFFAARVATKESRRFVFTSQKKKSAFTALTMVIDFAPIPIISQ
jgi:hypothetical protein